MSQDEEDFDQSEFNEGLVRDVENLKGRVENIEGRVNDLQDMFETYIEVEEDEE